MNNKKLEVSETFLREAHKLACSELKSKIENEFLELFRFYSIGQTFNNKKYILAQVGDWMVALIDLTSGNRHIDQVKVRDAFRITPEEFAQISANDCIFILDK